MLPGLLSPADSPQTCDSSYEQPFTRWGDGNHYVLVPGGSFEPNTVSWKLGRGARIVSGNESFYVHSAGDRHSLYVPGGVSVTTPPMCFAVGDWHMRLFARGSGKIRVRIQVKSLLGLLSVLDGGTVRAGSAWRPSPEVQMLLTNVTGLLATDSVSFRLTPSANTRVDDVYLDPIKSS
ncbi:MAG TPA: hypothetical protein VFW80_02830 [Gaiellaceae bacterium]|nr:hypothetical protein [Gaiellaceae bacterium]